MFVLILTRIMFVYYKLYNVNIEEVQIQPRDRSHCIVWFIT